MTRDRNITLGEFAEEDDESLDLSSIEDIGEDPGDMRAEGYGHCWIDDTRTCTRRCMAFNVSRVEEGEQACMIVQSLQQMLEPTLMLKEETSGVLAKLSRSIDENTRSNNTLVQTVQQALTRLR